MMNSLVMFIYLFSLSGAGLNPLEGLYDSFGGVIYAFILFITQAIATLAMLSVIIGGILYITAHGNEEQMTKAKQFIILPIIGTVIAIFAYVIVVVVTQVFS